MKPTQVIIIGGGLAGCISAIHLAKKGLKVLLIEKKIYPFHKFCGEYLSQEVLPYLNSLGIFPLALGATEITRFRLSSHTDKYAEAKLPLGGLGIRRFSIDYQILTQAQALGVSFLQGKEVRTVSYQKGIHTLICKDKSVFKAPIVIGAYGKRSILDKTLERKFFKQESSYIGVKYYFEYEYPADMVSLHNFQGGYCGMAKMEDASLNLCYLSRKDILNEAGNIEALEKQVLSKNPHIKHVFETGKKLLKNPLIISNISFESKEITSNHVLMCGDSAGMIFPLAGNGMAMSIHAAKILSELVLLFFSGAISRDELEEKYIRRWKSQFESRLAWGRRFQPFMGHNMLSNFAVSTLRFMPPLLSKIIKQTHGNPIHALS